MSKDEREIKKVYFGKCLIEVPKKSVLQLLILEVLNPFYIMQIYSIVLWSLEKYFVYSLVIFLLSIVFVALSLYDNF